MKRLLWILTGVVAGLSSLAAGQMGSMSMGLVSADSFRPDISERDLKIISRVLELPADSQQALQALYDGYAGTLSSEGRAVKEFLAGEIERAEALQDSTLLSAASARVAKWNERSEQVKKAFLEDLKSLLSQEEEARWPLAEREIRRFKLLPQGILSGEDVDLVRLVDEVGVAETPELSAMLIRYREELDRSLLARKALLDEQKPAYEGARKAGDVARTLAIWEDVHKARLSVQGVNDRYARLLLGQMPDSAREPFEQKYFALCYRAVCKETRAETYLKDALALKSLSPEQRQQLVTIDQQYQKRRATMLKGLAAGWRDYEELARPGSDSERSEGVRSGKRYNGAWLPESHPLVKGRKDRYEADKELRTQVDQVLSREQRDEVPTRLTDVARFEDWGVGGL